MARALKKAGPNLVESLQKRLKVVQQTPPPTKKDWLRVSSLAEMCPRAGVLAARHQVVQERTIEFYEQLTWDLGKGAHWTMQNNVMPKLDDVLIGTWQCHGCGTVYGTQENYIARPTECPKGCKKRPEQQVDESLFEYVEMWFRDHDHRVAGHPDGILKIEELEGNGVLEIKSISDFSAKKVRDVPDFGHVIQLQAYLWLTGLTWGIIVYWNKGSWKEPLNQHFIERDESTIDSIKELALSYWAGMDEKNPLPDRICSSADCNRAEKCQMVKLCFKKEESDGADADRTAAD